MAGLSSGVGGSTVGIGENFAKARLLLAKRAGYMPQQQQIDTENPSAQWKAVSSNLKHDAQQAGYGNPMQFLRQGATQGGNMPPTRGRPGNVGNPQGALAYSNSRVAALAAQAPRPLPALGPVGAIHPQAPLLPAQTAEIAARLAALQGSLLPRRGVIS